MSYKMSYKRFFFSQIVEERHEPRRNERGDPGPLGLVLNFLDDALRVNQIQQIPSIVGNGHANFLHGQAESGLHRLEELQDSGTSLGRDHHAVHPRARRPHRGLLAEISKSLVSEEKTRKNWRHESAHTGKGREIITSNTQ